jgi:putative FmdB family regulatory protein
MPLYEYECDACGQRFEKIQKFSDAPLDACGKCGKGPVRKLMSSPAIQFKGSGWYITDYANKAKGDAAAAGKAGGGAAADASPTSDAAAKGNTAAKGDTAAKSESASGASTSESSTSTAKKA